jgi:hypothetical protein
MQPIRSLVSKYFPEEKITKDSKVFLTTSGITKAGKLPLSAGISWITANMVETDKKFYFDFRIPLDYLTYLALSFVILAIPLLFLALQLTQTLVPKPIIGIILFAILLVAGFISYLIANTYKEFGNIGIIKKEWITGSSVNGNETIINGQLPVGEVPSFMNQLLVSNKIKATFLAITINKVSTILNSFVTTNFTIKYK